MNFNTNISIQHIALCLFCGFLFASLPLIKIWKIPKIKSVSFQQWEDEHPVVKVISQVQEQKRDSLLQITPQKRWRMCFSFLKYYTAKSKKKGDWVCCQNCNAWYYEIYIGATGKRQSICGRRYWSKLYHQVIGIVPTEAHFVSNVTNF